MSASHWQGVDRRPLRIGFAALVALFTLQEVQTLYEQQADAHYRLGHAPLAALLPATPAALAAVCALVFAALYALAADRRPMLAATAALAGMAVVSRWGVEYFGMLSHNFMYPGGMLFGWLLGLVYARTRAAPEAPDRALSEELAEAGAMGVFASLYVGSALSKVVVTGFGWANPYTLRVLLLSQHGLARLGFIDAYRALIIEHPAVAQLGALLTLVVEGGAFFVLVSRRMRMVWGAVIFLLHANIIVLATMPYIEPMSFVVLFAVPWPDLLKLPRAEHREPAGSRMSWPVLYGLLALALLGALFPIGWDPFHGH